MSLPLINKCQTSSCKPHFSAFLCLHNGPTNGKLRARSVCGYPGGGRHRLVAERSLILSVVIGGPGFVFCLERAQSQMAFLNQVVRAVEPYLKAFSYRLTSPWKGNHIVYVSAASRVLHVWKLFPRDNLFSRPYSAEWTPAATQRFVRDHAASYYYYRYYYCTV